MSLEEFENWRERNVCNKKNIIRAYSNLLFNKKLFFGSYKDQSTIIRTTSVFLRKAECAVSFEPLGNQSQVKIKTELPSGPLIYIIGVLMLVVVGFLTILPAWIRSELSSDPFQLFSGEIITPFMIVLVLLVVQHIYISYSVKKVHRLVKQSLLNK